MKRKTFKITVMDHNTVLHEETKNAWNSAIRAIPNLIRKTLQEGQTAEFQAKTFEVGVFMMQSWKVMPAANFINIQVREV
jgi:hypothetical protein